MKILRHIGAFVVGGVGARITYELFQLALSRITATSWFPLISDLLVIAVWVIVIAVWIILYVYCISRWTKKETPPLNKPTSPPAQPER